MAEGSQLLTTHKSNQISSPYINSTTAGLLIFSSPSYSAYVRIKDTTANVTSTNNGISIRRAQPIAETVDKNDKPIALVSSFLYQTGNSELALQLLNYKTNGTSSTPVGLTITYPKTGSATTTINTIVSINPTTAASATSLTTGALRVTGGVGISDSLFAQKLNVNEMVSLEWNSTDNSLDFIFT